MIAGFKSLFALACVAGLLACLFWLDSTRGGPATLLSRCNLALARAELPPADVLLIGSSRTGVALDPVAIQLLLQHDLADKLTVERLALGNTTLRISYALLDTYLSWRGAPKFVVLEANFMTKRTVDRLAIVAGDKPSELYLLARDLNLMSFDQLVAQAAIAMPFTNAESAIGLWKVRLRSVVLRAGALLYQFTKAPFNTWGLAECDRAATTQEPTWPEDFSFSYDDYRPEASAAETIKKLRAELIAASASRQLKDWQTSGPQDRVYPYDFAADYRSGELTYFLEMLRKARAAGARVLVLPLPLYGYRVDRADLEYLANALPDGAEIFDLYGAVGADFSRFWYDDAHLEKYPAGALTSALMAERLEIEANMAAGHD